MVEPLLSPLMSEVADLSPPIKTAGVLFLSRQYNKFYSTLEKLRREDGPCQMIEEGRLWGKDLETQHSASISTHQESTQPFLGWRRQSTYFEKGYIGRKVKQATWQRRFRLAGHVALLILSLMSVYLVIYVGASRT
jgi:hypothetical protein